MKKLERIIRNGKNALVGTGLLASVACSSVGTQLGRDLVVTGAYGFVGSAANEAGRRSAGGKDPSVTMNNYNGKSENLNSGSITEIVNLDTNRLEAKTPHSFFEVGEATQDYIVDKI